MSQPASPQPVRVTQLASGDLWAGAEAQLFALVTALRDGGEIDVDVILLNEGMLADRLRTEGITVTVFDERRHRLGQLAMRVLAHCRARGTRVLHTHRYKENVIGSAVRLMDPAVRTLRTVHGATEHPPRGLALKRRVQRAADWACARFVQWPVVAVSEPLAALLRRELPASRVRVVENGLRVAETERRATAAVALPAVGARTRVGFFGRMAPVKRVDLILEIAARLEARAPGAFAFLLFGDGPLLASLREEATRRGLSGHVHFMGFTSEVAANLRAMDAMLMTSDHEGLPMIVLEAMALGVPVVSHAVGAIPALLDEGRAGTLLATQEPDAYVEALLALRDAPAETAQRTTAAAARVRERYSAERTAADYAAIYREMAGTARR